MNTKQLKALKKIASKTTIKPVFHAIHFKDKKAVATNSGMLMQIDAFDIDECLVDVNHIDVLCHEGAKDWEMDNGEVIFSYFGYPCRVPTVGDEFPDWKQLIPKTEPLATTVLSVEYLEAMLGVLKKGSSQSVTISIYEKGKPVVLEAVSGEYGLIMPVKS